MRFLTLAVALLAVASPTAGMAAPVIKVFFPSSTPITANNNFKTNLAAAGFTRYGAAGTSLVLTGMARISYYYMGSESGFKDVFTANTFTVGSSTYTENSTGYETKWSTPILIGTQTYTTGGALNTLLKFTSNYGVAAGVGASEFGVFLKTSGTSATPLVTGTGYTTLYFGYDDERYNPDRDFDDFVVKAVVTAVPVPEPGTWAMMLAGFALVGASMRRRRVEGTFALV